MGDITLTASWTEATTPKYTVTFVDGEGNEIAAQIIVEGGNATLPTSGEYFYTFSPVDALYNITESKTIVLGTISKAGYEAGSHSMKRTNGEYDTYFTVSSTSGNKADYGTTIYGDNQFVTFKENMIGTINMYFSGAKLTETQYIDFEVLLDDVVVNSFRIVKATETNIDLCHISQYGEHRVTVRSVGSANLPEGNTKHNNSVVITGVNFYKELLPAVEYTVSFAGEGVDIPAQTVAEGHVANAPANPVRDGYTFAGWLLDGEAYDFATPVMGDITLTASWTEATAPLELTVTFVDEAGNVIGTDTVLPGENATLPSSREYFYTFSPADALYNITESKTVVLGKVEKSAYAQATIDMSKSNANYSDYFTVTDNSNNRITPATVLFNKGHAVTLNATMIGEVKFYISCSAGNIAEGQWFDVEVKVDGVVVNVIRVDHTTAQYVTACYIGEYGAHEVKLTVVDFANMPSGNHKRGTVVYMNSCQMMQAVE